MYICLQFRLIKLYNCKAMSNKARVFFIIGVSNDSVVRTESSLGVSCFEFNLFLSYTFLDSYLVN